MVLALFGLDLINLSNTLGFFFKDVDSAFKNSTIFMFLIGMVFPFVTLIGGAIITRYLDKSGDLTRVVYWFVFIISPFNALGEGLNECLFNGFIARGDGPDATKSDKKISELFT